MTLQRRLLLYLLVCAPLVWGAAVLVSVDRAQHQINELFDTEMIRLARQVQATLSSTKPGATTPVGPRASGGDAGEADVSDLAIAVWDASGTLLITDREGVQLPRRPDASGFVDLTLAADLWRVYYLQSAAGDWLVASGQKSHERDELVVELIASQTLPWLLVLPVLLLVMAWAVRRALAPLRHLTRDLSQRQANDLQPVVAIDTPAELQPLVAAMNGLLERIGAMFERERRFTADAAHELRTPLAVLRAQWDVLRRASDATARADAEARLGQGLERMDRLVTQMLALSRVDAALQAPPNQADVGWPAVVEQAMSDSLALAERRRVELACEWPPAGVHALPLRGDTDLLGVALRNLLDNALRYAPAGSTVVLRFGPDRLEVDNAGPPLGGAQLARLGERFQRVQSQAESGSGLGVSIVQRIATLHGLELMYGPAEGGQGVRATLRLANPTGQAPRALGAG